MAEPEASAIENGPVEIVDLPINSMVIVHNVLLTFTSLPEGRYDVGDYRIKLCMYMYIYYTVYTNNLYKYY